MAQSQAEVGTTEVTTSAEEFEPFLNFSSRIYGPDFCSSRLNNDEAKSTVPKRYTFLPPH